MVATGAERRWQMATAVGAAIVALSILTAVVIGELPDALWVIVVPVGMLGGAVVTIVSAGAWLAARSERGHAH